MEIKCTKQDVMLVLGAAIKAVPSKTSFPIMECVLLDVSDGILSATATDGGLSIRAHIKAVGEGRACVNAKMFYDAISLIPDGGIELSSDGSAITVDYGSGRFVFPEMSIKDFPDVQFPETDATSMASVMGDELKSSLSFVIPSVAKDNMRPQLSGVYFNPNGDGYDVVGTDAHVLSIQKVSGNVGTGDFILPFSAALFLKNQVHGPEKVFFMLNGASVAFFFDNIVVNVATTVGKYPKYDAIIPKKNEHTASAPVSELLSSIKRISTCSSKEHGGIRLSLSQIMGCMVEARDMGYGCSASEDLPFMQYTGPEMAVGFKYETLLSVLGVIEEQEVTLYLESPRKAVLIASMNAARQAIIMPIQI